jgi:hypothetical protein
VLLELLVRGHSSFSPLALEYSVTTYNYERQANQDVQNIINPSPKKITLGREIKTACQRLVEINQSEPSVKETDQPLFP